jgi:MFS family permease
MRSPAMRRVQVAFLLFRTAERATWVALLIWAFERGGEAAVGAIVMAQMLPAMIIAPFAAVVADRVARPTALRAGYLVQGITKLAVAGVLLSEAPFWLIAALTGVAASSMTMTRPVHHALIPEISRTPDELTAGNTASSVAKALADFLGPAVAGLALATLDVGWLFVVLGLAALFSAGLVWRIAVLQRVVDRTDMVSYWTEVLQGLRTVGRDHGARALTTLAAARYVAFGLVDVLAVVYALELLRTGPAGPGFLTSAIGVGSLVGSAVAITLIGRSRMAPALALGAGVVGGALVVLPASSSFTAAVVLFSVAGAGSSYLQVAARTLLQRNVEPRVLGRVLGIHEALQMGGAALGAAATPAVLVWIGVPWTFAVASLLLPVAVVGTWSRLRRLDRDAVLPGPALGLLRQNPTFAAVPQPQLEQLVAALEPVAPPQPGQDVVTQGEVGDRYYVIVSGSATVLRDGVEVAKLGPGQGFGEIALLRRGARRATVRAGEGLELLALDREPFLLAVTGSAASYESVNRAIDALLEPDDKGVGDDRDDDGGPAG